MKILFASNNPDKVADTKQVLGELYENIEVVSLVEAGIEIEVEETEETLQGNALKKARAVFELVKESKVFDYVLAEDFGFFVQAFPQVAGVYAKRWFDGANKDRAAKIVQLFEETKEQNRSAKFACAVAAIDKSGSEQCTLGELIGEIGTDIPTKEGFGYNQIVKMPDGRYLADYTAQEKLQVAARPKALKSLILK